MEFSSINEAGNGRPGTPFCAYKMKEENFFGEIRPKDLTNRKKDGKIVNCIIIACSMRPRDFADKNRHGRLHKSGAPESAVFGAGGGRVRRLSVDPTVFPGIPQLSEWSDGINDRIKRAETWSERQKELCQIPLRLSASESGRNSDQILQVVS